MLVQTCQNRIQCRKLMNENRALMDWNLDLLHRFYPRPNTRYA
jgi:hypothetical protein